MPERGGLCIEPPYMGLDSYSQGLSPPRQYQAVVASWYPGYDERMKYALSIVIFALALTTVKQRTASA